MNFVFWGGTGQAKVLREIVDSQNLGRIIAVFDNNSQTPPPFADVPIFYGIAAFYDFLKNAPKPLAGVAAIGGARGADRLHYLNLFKENNLATPNLVHRTATLLTTIPENFGIQILANVTLGVHCQLGRGVILNSCANVEHECTLADGVHIAPSATLLGVVNVGENAFVGANATILPFLNIGKNATIGAGSVVLKNVADFAKIAGNPAKAI